MSCSNGFIATFCDDAMLFRKQFLFLAKIQRLDIICSTLSFLKVTE